MIKAFFLFFERSEFFLSPQFFSSSAPSFLSNGDVVERSFMIQQIIFVLASNFEEGVRIFAWQRVRPRNSQRTESLSERHKGATPPQRGTKWSNVSMGQSLSKNQGWCATLTEDNISETPCPSALPYPTPSDLISGPFQKKKTDTKTFAVQEETSVVRSNLLSYIKLVLFGI